MPGRTSTRTTRAARAGAGTRSARSSAIEVPDEGPATSLRTRIVQVFSDAQKTTATQRKLVVTLRKIQEEVCFEPLPGKGKKGREDEDDEDDFDEQDFSQEVIRNILRVMNVKKSEPVGDRVVRFITLFLKYASEKDQKNAVAANEDASEPTPSSRLNTQVLSTLLRFFASKDKTVRFRAVQMVTQMLNSLHQIDSDVYTVLRLSLQKRLRDK